MRGIFVRLRLGFVPTVFCTILICVAAHRAQAAQDAAIDVARYIDVAPAAIGKPIAVLRSEAAAARKDAGARSVLVLQEIGRPSRFLLLENWTDEGAYQAHEKAARDQDFRKRLMAIEIAPPDVRVVQELWARRPANAPTSNAIVAATHVDVMPAYQAEAAAMLKSLGAAASLEKGNLGFVVAPQLGRANHFTVIEIWADRKAFDAHETAAATKSFRERLTPMQGALYDQRLYRIDLQ